jgi:hypothetical protein
MSGAGMSAMSYFLADKPSVRMETRFTYITEPLTHAWRWQLAASVLFFCGWMQTAMQEMHTAHRALFM